jgi:polar amino acid transport system permease protein
MHIFEVFFNWEVFRTALPVLLLGLLLTIELGVVSIILGTIGGLALALVRLYAPPFFQRLAVFYIDAMRAMPLLVLLVMIYYTLPFIDIRLSAFASAAAAISLVSSAYTAEIFRSGIEAIPHGQFEASRALGLTYWQMMADVILPQAFKIAIPPLTNNAISVMKDTALASVVAMPDLLKMATQAQAVAANPTPLFGAAFFYLLMLLPMVRLVSLLERRFTARTGRKAVA